MLELAELKENETLYDLGCGDGRIILEAAQKFGANVVGVELDEGRYRECTRQIQKSHLDDRVEIIHGNLLDVDLHKADVVTLYLLTSANEKVRGNLQRDLKAGARVVSHDFPITKWTPSKVKELRENFGSHTLYLYVI
jgi:predicted RNA methylase